MSQTRRRARRGLIPALDRMEDRRLPTSTLAGSTIISLIEFAPNSSRPILESAGRQIFAVIRTGDLSGTATVRVRTEAGTALAGYDFRSLDLTLTFAPGESQKTFVVDVVDDKVAEAPFKSFSLVLSSPTGGAGLGQTSTAAVFIQDDEPGSVQPLMLLDYGVFGTWTYDASQGFQKISADNPQAVLASGNRNGYLDLGPDGLWMWDSLRGLRKLDDRDAQAMVVINNDWTRVEDVLLVDFGPDGLWRFSESQGWRQLSEVDPRSIVVDRQTVYIDFGHGGLWRWGDAIPWYKLSDLAPEGMAADAAVLYVDYGSAGLWTWSAAESWTQIATGDPQSIAVGGGVYYADYGSAGLWAWTKGGSWTRLAAADPRSMVAVGGELYVDYGVYGLWAYSARPGQAAGFRKLSEAVADSMAYSLRGNRMIVSQGAAGLWAWSADAPQGRRLNAAAPESFSTA